MEVRYKHVVALTPRDVDLLTFCALHKGAPVGVVARRFFATHPTTGEPNKDPDHACRRRLKELVALGFLEPIAARGDRRIAAVTAKAAAALGVAKRDTVALKGRAHHVATLTYLQDLTERYAAQGVKVLNIRLEFQLRSDLQAGHRTRKGDAFDAFPDAVFELERPTTDGSMDREEHALEYVTQKYSDRDIIDKAESFTPRYDSVVWVADKKTTAKRLSALTGRPSEVWA